MFIVLAVSMSIGGAILVLTNSTTTTLVGTSTLMSNITTYAGNSVITFVQFLPVLAIALVGGLALFYILSYVGGMGRE